MHLLRSLVYISPPSLAWWIHSTPFHPIHFKIHLILSSRSLFCLPGDLFHFFLPGIYMHFWSLRCMLHVPSHHNFLDLVILTIVGEGYKLPKALFIQLSPVTSYLLYLMSKCSQNSILKHPQSEIFPLHENLLFTNIQMWGAIIVLHT